METFERVRTIAACIKLGVEPVSVGRAADGHLLNGAVQRYIVGFGDTASGAGREGGDGLAVFEGLEGIGLVGCGEGEAGEDEEGEIGEGVEEHVGGWWMRFGFGYWGMLLGEVVLVNSMYNGTSR